MSRLHERYPRWASWASASMSPTSSRAAGTGIRGGISAPPHGIAGAGAQAGDHEKVLIENLRVANRVFNELSAMGVRFRDRRFRHGYSALTYLQNTRSRL